MVAVIVVIVVIWEITGPQTLIKKELSQQVTRQILRINRQKLLETVSITNWQQIANENAVSNCF